MSPRTGRPPKENPRSKQLVIRLTPEEKAKIQECADNMSMTKTDVILYAIDQLLAAKAK